MSSAQPAKTDSTNRMIPPACPEVVAVIPVEHLRLAVRFADGLAGEVLFKPSHLHGVFEVLNDPAVFGKVHCAEGFVVWPGHLDLAPDAMYEEIKRTGRWVLE